MGGEDNGGGATATLARENGGAAGYRQQVSEIGQGFNELAQKQVELLQAEIAEQASRAARAVAFAGTAGAIGLVCAAFAFVTLMFVLDTFMDNWAAALITTAVAAVVAAVVALVARRTYKSLTVVPMRTINSIKEDAEWARGLL
jgi:uncharacterized membrane protein YqjE